MKPRIIVCGLGPTGYNILCLLRQQGADVVGIHNQPIPGEDKDVLVGDGRSAATLLAAGIREAQAIVLADREDGVNLAVLMQARVLNPRIRIVNRLFNTSLGDRLDNTLPDHITMSVAALAAPIFAFAALGNAAIGQLRLFNQTWPIHEEYIEEGHPWCGRKLSELWDDRDRMLIYYLPVDSRVDLVTAVTRGMYLQVGDRLIIGTKPSVRQTQRSLTRKLSKLALGLKYLRQHSRPLLAGTMLLLAVIFISTLTYISSVLHASPIDALYFSVGIITGAGANDIGVDRAPASLKLFTVITMLVGAAIIGLSYALLNDFVLGTRFDRFWDAARLPQRGHFIVCGLGGVGVQIVSHLCSYGHEVVVIEQDPHCRFLNTVRAMKIPVIQGDASLPATLAAAHFEQAQALLAVTSNDMANLEIALNAKGLNPKSSVIVRYQDPEFAHMAQKVFEFEAVFSPAELVAPAFTAAALGGRILGNGMTADSLWVALATVITPGHPFCGLRVQEIATEADCVPLYVVTRCQTIHGWDLLDICLSAGDVLYLTMPASQLELLWRSVASPYATSVEMGSKG
ncbi:NAD-binding protein [Kovacikia minuta CCNUW1]|uniref:potassium channel family protein n=1 Tax=Kovacikia minuta TaxID=2931930 RepID=UPI001CCB9F51|nr:NAD-binding protein [Kovacikia minuta]UBF24608.1 NAD-binding protein [Kovacikia minuta CCNUW1]